jgi:hypothetical protein
MAFDVRIRASDLAPIVIIEVLAVVFATRLARSWTTNGIAGLHGKLRIHDSLGIVTFGVAKAAAWIEPSVSLVGPCPFDRVHVCATVAIEIRVVHARSGMITVVDRRVNLAPMIG